MQQDQQQQQQRQQREEDKERQQKESMRGARAPPLSLSLFLSRCVPTGKNCHYILPDRGITLGGG